MYGIVDLFNVESSPYIHQHLTGVLKFAWYIHLSSPSVKGHIHIIMAPLIMHTPNNILGHLSIDVCFQFTANT